MKYQVFGICIALVIGLVSAIQTCAQDEPAEKVDRRPDPEVVDSDSDGVITLDELKEFLQEEHFDDWSEKIDPKLADGDSDDETSSEELKKLFSDKYLDAWAQKVDANENGKISKMELRLILKALDPVIAEEGEKAEAEASRVANKPPTSSIELMNERFQARKPAIGTRLKDLIALGEDGEEVNLGEMRGKHIVVVFGCLT